MFDFVRNAFFLLVGLLTLGMALIVAYVIVGVVAGVIKQIISDNKKSGG